MTEDAAQKYCILCSTKVPSVGSCGGASDKSLNTSTRAFSRKNRVYVFREFLLETYKGYLSAGDIVLDVAGGKGSLSWLLENVDDIRTMVIDPNVTNANSVLKSIQFLKENPSEAELRAIPGLPTYQPLATLMPRLIEKATFRNPSHMRTCLDDELLSALESSMRQLNVSNKRTISKNINVRFTPACWEEYWSATIEKNVHRVPVTNLRCASKPECQAKDACSALNTLLNARLVVGFHPDQATDSCVDLARLLGIPVCIVPCCVFPSEFPNRMLPDGNLVRYYDDLLLYLERIKMPTNTKRATLNFVRSETARNVVLYTTERVE